MSRYRVKGTCKGNSKHNIDINNKKKIMLWYQYEHGWYDMCRNMKFKAKRYISMDSRGGLVGLGQPKLIVLCRYNNYYLCHQEIMVGVFAYSTSVLYICVITITSTVIHMNQIAYK